MRFPGKNGNPIVDKYFDDNDDLHAYFWRRNCSAGTNAASCVSVVEGSTYFINGRQDAWHLEGITAM
jgi:hypothetical protein